MSEQKKIDQDSAKVMAAFARDIFEKALDSMRDQLSPEELDAMRQEGEATISGFEKNNIE